MSPDQEDLTPGTLIAQRYRIVEKIGSGGMGAVYEALQEGLGRRVALKVLRSGYAESEEAVARFQREAQASASLGHPNIVTVTDFGTDAGRLFMVMERLDGAPLSKVIAAERALSAQRAAWIASQVLSALAAAHRAGIVHRDMKPDNVFLTEVSGVRDVVKVLDFGVARFTDAHGNSNLTNTGAVLGTPAYMSPEQARGRAVDARSDLYSVGVLLYEMLSGRQPFQANNYHALLFAILEETPPALGALRPDLAPALLSLIERAMSKDVSTRFQTADELRAALAPWLSATAVDAYGATAEVPQVSLAQMPLSATPSLEIAPAAAAQATAQPFAMGGAGSMFAARPAQPSAPQAPPAQAAPSQPAPARVPPPQSAPASAFSPAIVAGLVVLAIVSVGAALSVRRAIARGSRSAQHSARSSVATVPTTALAADASLDIDATLAAITALAAQLADASQMQQAMIALGALSPPERAQTTEAPSAASDPAAIARAFENAPRQHPRGTAMDPTEFMASSMHRRNAQAVYMRSSVDPQTEAFVRRQLTAPTLQWNTCALLSERIPPDLAATGWTYSFDIELGSDGRMTSMRAGDALTRRQLVAAMCFQGVITNARVRLVPEGSEVRSMTVVFANRYVR
ncbi:MAG: serine/threonine-protein kinase [Polyangiales bacterium]